MQGFFHGGIGIAEPLLHEVGAQHGRQFKGTAAVAGFGIMRLDRSQQMSPGNDGFHLKKKFLAPGCLGFLAKSRAARLSCFMRKNVSRNDEHDIPPYHS